MWENKKQNGFNHVGVFGSFLGDGLQSADHRHQAKGGADSSLLTCFLSAVIGPVLLGLEEQRPPYLFLESPAPDTFQRDILEPQAPAP